MEKTMENVVARLKEYGVFTETEINIALAIGGKNITTLERLIMECTDFGTLDNFMTVCDKWDKEDMI